MHILPSAQKRGNTHFEAIIHGRSTIEPAIGHMKIAGCLDCNSLQRAPRNAIYAVMCDAGHSLRLIPTKLQLLAARFALAFTCAVGGVPSASGLHQLMTSPDELRGGSAAVMGSKQGYRRQSQLSRQHDAVDDGIDPEHRFAAAADQHLRRLLGANSATGEP